MWRVCTYTLRFGCAGEFIGESLYDVFVRAYKLYRHVVIFIYFARARASRFHFRFIYFTKLVAFFRAIVHAI